MSTEVECDKTLGDDTFRVLDSFFTMNLKSKIEVWITVVNFVYVTQVPLTVLV